MYMIRLQGIDKSRIVFSDEVFFYNSAREAVNGILSQLATEPTLAWKNAMIEAMNNGLELTKFQKSTCEYFVNIIDTDKRKSYTFI